MRMFVVAGDPISHSLSPVMHNAAFRCLGLDDCIYQPLKIGKGSIDSLVSLLREGKVAGANVTYPLKEVIIPHLDKLSVDAGVCRSVNTVSLSGDMLIGDTTDGEGCVNALQARGVDLMGAYVLIIGAGGAAKAIAHSIAKRGPGKVYVVNRTLERAQRLVGDLHEFDNLVARPWEDMHHCLGKSDILINCTTVGMEGSNASLPIGQGDLDSGKAVMDIVYDPIETDLLEAARDAGSLAINGLEMLVHQGAISFERWTGLRPPINVMKNAIEKHLMVNFHEGSDISDRVHG